ncbi:cation diffusion facilitator family transporter [uncultured Marixanthomonas sp.]|uniref:cation diffusion facilitator family transporter n=1 Tax=uncultured Marixanthomonas sp. TaxID=757245 RepID=UPI0030D8827B|tara:strand:- start:59887 stop:60855 length:969 start_codon:yes stop_codon:yes gene_type:complete
MKSINSFHLPKSLQEKLSKAKRLEWITICYLITVVILMYLVMGNSQAMKTAWLEDALSILPAISFLIAYRFYNKKPTQNFPYGYHRVFDIAHLTGALALFLMGSYLLIDSSISLLTIEKPTIGSFTIWGQQIWLGWLMIALLIYSSIPAMFLGHAKLPLSKALHNKILFTDAQAQKADWTTALAAMLGIVGVGLGFWWADATAALFISFSVLKDGYSNLKDAILELMDRHPVTVKKENDTIGQRVVNYLCDNYSSDIIEVGVRLREHGQTYFGEILIISNAPVKCEQIRKDVLELHWKLIDVSVMPVTSIPPYFLTRTNITN